MKLNLVFSLPKISNMAAITTCLNYLKLRKTGVKKDLIKNRNGFTFRRNWRNSPRCRVRRLHFLRRKLCGRASVHGYTRMRYTHHSGKHGSTTTTSQLVRVEPREGWIAWVHLGTVKVLQLTGVRHSSRYRAVGHRHHAEAMCEHSRICNAMVWHGVVLVRAVDVHNIVHVVRLVHVFLVQFSQLGIGQFIFEVVVARLVAVWDMFLHLSLKHALNRVRHLSVPWWERERAEMKIDKSMSYRYQL